MELEGRLEVVLVNRTTRKVELTRAGIFLCNEARDILQRVDVAETTTRSFSKGTKALIRITYMNLVGHALVPDIVLLFTQRHPEIRCEMTYLTSPLQLEGIERGDINVGFIVGPYKSNSISSKVVANHPLMVLLPGSHPLREKKVISVQDLANVPLILGTHEEWPTLRRIIDDVFESAGLQPVICQEASSLTGILGLVTTGLAPTIFCGVPRFCEEPAIIPRKLVASVSVSVQSTMIWRKNKMTIAIRRFLESADEVSQHYL